MGPLHIAKMRFQQSRSAILNHNTLKTTCGKRRDTLPTKPINNTSCDTTQSSCDTTQSTRPTSHPYETYQFPSVQNDSATKRCRISCRLSLYPSESCTTSANYPK